jgi:hypothetical protein
MFDDYQNIHGYAKQHLIEMIMARTGSGLQRARAYRTDLESMTLAEVRREKELIETQDEE